MKTCTPGGRHVRTYERSRVNLLMQAERGQDVDYWLQTVKNWPLRGNLFASFAWLRVKESDSYSVKISVRKLIIIIVHLWENHPRLDVFTGACFQYDFLEYFKCNNFFYLLHINVCKEDMITLIGQRTLYNRVMMLMMGWTSWDIHLPFVIPIIVPRHFCFLIIIPNDTNVDKELTTC